MTISLSELFGRLHPLLVHFPIVLMLLTAALEVWRLRGDMPGSPSAEQWLAALAALAAVLTAVSGWVFGLEHHRSDTAELLDDHRWMGVTTAILAVLAAGAVWRWNETADPRLRWLRRLVVWAGAIVLIIAAHLGAMLVWGGDYFSS